MDVAGPVSQSPLASRRWARAVLWLPAAVGLLSTPLIYMLAVAQSLTFFGEQVSPQQAQATTAMLVWAAVYSAGAPLAGLGVAVMARSSRALRLYGIAFVIACLPGLFWAALDADRTSAPTEGVNTCQEHSGGDPRCPGG